MTKKKDKIDINNKVEIDIGSFLENALKGNESNIDYEKALSYGLLYSLTEFSKTSESSKYDSKYMAILSKACPLMKTLCANISLGKKDLKRTKENKWLKIITSMTRNIKVNDEGENRGIFSFLHRKKEF